MLLILIVINIDSCYYFFHIQCAGNQREEFAIRRVRFAIFCNVMNNVYHT